MLKDFLAVLLLATLFFLIVFFVPDMYGYFIETDNYLPANSMQSPPDIKPLWYLTPYYGILKVIPNKTLGVALMFASQGILFFIPWLDKSPVRTMRDKGLLSKLALVCMLISFFGLGYLSMRELTTLNTLLARTFVFSYFASILLMPYYTKYEKCKQPE